VSGARTDVTDSSVKDHNFHPIENFSRIDVDKFAAGDDQVCLDRSGCALNQPPQFRSGSHHVPFVTQRYLGYQIRLG